MKIAFLSNKLTLRGTEITIWDYAHFTERILGHQAIIITRPLATVLRVSPRDVHPAAYLKFTDRFDVHYYEEPHQVEDIAKAANVDVLFIEKAGSPNDGLVFPKLTTIIHCVFTLNEPHGTLYTSISEFLNSHCSTNYPVLPNMIHVADNSEDLRQTLGIPPTARVFGSMSGADEYTVDYVRNVVEHVSQDPSHPNIYFVFLNIDPFGSPGPRLIFLPGTADMQYKRAFINTCDAMLYGRSGGETFGLACGEFALCGKPVIGRGGEPGASHELLLGKSMIKHQNYQECFEIVTSWPRHAQETTPNGYLEYTPDKVMANFEKHLQALCAETQNICT